MTEKKRASGSSGKQSAIKKRTRRERSTNKDQLEKQLKQAGEEIAVLKDRLLRMAAELDNLRKRTQKEIQRMTLEAGEQILRDILPVVDDLERSLKIADHGNSGPEFRKGLELIHGNMLSVLEKNGVRPIESEGEPFDVHLHDAIMQTEKKDTPPGIVVEEHVKGYLLNDRVLRHAKVVVSK
jgi:molecular chaperone GrpE